MRLYTTEIFWNSMCRRSFQAELLDKSSFTLVGRLVSPGFTYQGFTLFSPRELIALYPQHDELIRRFTRIPQDNPRTMGPKLYKTGYL